MMTTRSLVLATSFVLGCVDLPQAVSPSAAIGGLNGFVTTATNTRPTRATISQIRTWRTPDPKCSANTIGAIELTGNVMNEPGPQTVLVSFDHLVVLDRANALVAAAPTGFRCEGSADQLDAVAIGSMLLDGPVIAIVATSGGEMESMTRVALFQIDRNRALVRLFSGAVFANDGVDHWYGSVTVVPGGIIHRPPGDPPTAWRFDRAAGRYIETGTTSH
jgi:hypothetical protein